MTSKERMDAIEDRLKNRLSPSTLLVEDESHLHVGHPGAKTGRGHYHLTISSPCFLGQSPITCHRLIYEALDDLMKNDIHALRITLLK